MKRKRKNKSIVGFVFTYFLVVFLFAAIDWAIFRNNTTSFLISEQLNKRVDRYEFVTTEFNLATYHLNAKDLMPINVSDFTIKIMPQLNLLSLINDSISILAGSIVACESKLDSIVYAANDERENVIRLYRERELKSYIYSIDSLKEEMKGKDSTKLVLEGKFVEEANLQLKYAEKELSICNYILNNYGLFVPSEIMDSFHMYTENLLLLKSAIENKEKQRRVIVNDITNEEYKFNYNRRTSVGFIDFLYYSICVSTTVSFGDIAPNNDATRFLAVFELFICILLVGFILDRIIKRRKDSDNCG